MTLRAKVVAYVGIIISVCWVSSTLVMLGCAQLSEEQFRNIVFLTDKELDFVGSEWQFLGTPNSSRKERWPDEELNRQLQEMGEWLLVPTKIRESVKNYSPLFIHVVSIEAVASTEASKTFQHVEVSKNVKGDDDLFTWFRFGRVGETPMIRVSGMLTRNPGVDVGPPIVEAHRHFTLENDKWVEVESKYDEP